jgi:hypothetical protein
VNIGTIMNTNAVCTVMNTNTVRTVGEESIIERACEEGDGEGLWGGEGHCLQLAVDAHRIHAGVTMHRLRTHPKRE